MSFVLYVVDERPDFLRHRYTDTINSRERSDSEDWFMNRTSVVHSPWRSTRAIARSTNMAALMYNVSRGFVIFGERSLLLRGYNNHRIVVNSRRYVRALRRRPVAVLYPDVEREKLIKSKEATVKTNQKLFTPKDKHREKVSERAGSQQWSGHVSECAEESPQMRDTLAGLRFEKAPAGDNRLAWVHRLLQKWHQFIDILEKYINWVLNDKMSD